MAPIGTGAGQWSVNYTNTGPQVLLEPMVFGLYLMCGLLVYFVWLGFGACMVTTVCQMNRGGRRTFKRV